MMKKNYYLERTPQQRNGTVLVHAEDCQHLPRDKRKVDLLGRFNMPYPALAEARRITLRADVCRHCCRELLPDDNSLTHQKT